MKHLRKVLVLILVAAMLFTVSCTKKPAGTTTSSGPKAGDSVTLWKKGAATTDYVVIYAETDVEAADALLSALEDAGLSLSAYIDTEKPEGKKEILVGSTDRALSEKLKAAVLAEEAASGGLAWGFLLENGKFAVYATDAVAYDGTTAWESCIIDFENVYLAADFKAIEGKTVVHGISAEELAEEEEEINGPAIEKLRTNIAKNSARSYGNVAHMNKSAYKVSVTPADVHPRLALNTARIGELNTVVEGLGNTATALYYQYGDNAAAWERMKDLTEAEETKANTFGTLPSKGSKTSNGSFATLEAIEALAFRYAVEHKRPNDEATIYGLRAVNGLLNYLYTETIASDIDSLVYRRAGYVMYVAAEVYDWCYDLLTETDKNNIVAHVTSFDATKFEVAEGTDNPTPSAQGPVAGHGSEAQLLRDWLAFAIAVYDEYPEYYTYVVGRIQNEYVSVRNQYYVSETVGQGTSYGIYRLNFDINAEIFFETMQDTDEPVKLFDVDFSALARGLMYQVRPDDTLLRLGDGMNERTLVSSNDKRVYKMWDYGKTMFYAASLTGDGMAKSEASRFLEGFTKFFWDDNSLTAAQFLVYNDPTLRRVSSTELPLANYFPYPSGSMIAFNSRNNDGAMVYMKIGERHTANHEHADIGSFLIYYKGSLAIDAGFYDAYSTPAEDYCRSAEAHNVLMIGGKGQSVSRGEPITFKDMQETATVIGEEIVYNDREKPTEVYLAGDLTGSYTQATGVKRYMLAVYNYDADGKATSTPLCFFVMDSVDTATSKNVDFLLHSMEQPTVNGNTVVIKKTGTVDTGKQKVVCSGVLVDQAFVDSGSVTLTTTKTSYGLTAGKENVPQDRWDYNVDFIESGWGYTSVTATGTDVNMLNVMYVTDNSTYASEGKHVAVSYSNDTVLGATVADLGVAAFFNKTASELTAATVKGEGTGTLRYTVCGMAAGTYTVKLQGGASVATVTVTEESGMLTFSAAGGTYEITKN